LSCKCARLVPRRLAEIAVRVLDHSSPAGSEPIASAIVALLQSCRWKIPSAGFDGQLVGTPAKSAWDGRQVVLYKMQLWREVPQFN